MELTKDEVRGIVRSFLEHIAAYWNQYEKNLPQLARTMRHYNEFAYAIRSLPENKDCAIEFNPKYPLIEDIGAVFGAKWDEQIGNLVYDAWGVAMPPRGKYEAEEPLPDTPEALHEKYRNSIFPTIEAARRHMYEVEGAGYGWYNGQRMKLQICGTPEYFFHGFTTVEEFPEQKQFLDSIRNHPRIKEALQLSAKEDREWEEEQTRMREMLKRMKRTDVTQEKKKTFFGRLIAKAKKSPPRK